MTTRLIGALAASALLVAACGDNPASPSGTGSNLRLMLTDAPAGVDQVNIYFTSVDAKPVGGPLEHLALNLASNPIDLLTLDDRVVGFAAGEVDAGEYEFLHINIDQSRSYLVENGVRKTLRIPSQEIKVVGGFEIDDDTRDDPDARFRRRRVAEQAGQRRLDDAAGGAHRRQGHAIPRLS